ncbi:MAG TPA: RNase adapter RapZ [Magnetospirillaceae bacterium]
MSPLSGSATHARANGAARSNGRVVVVTGMSGAGRSTALKYLEDLGYEAVDNLPLTLLAPLLRAPLPNGQKRRPIAIGIDIRTRDFGASAMLAELDRLADGKTIDLKLVFLDCDDDQLARRFTETRRLHPLAAERPLADGIAHERQLVAPLRGRADVVIDTTALRPAEFKSTLQRNFGLDRTAPLVLSVMSFSYRHGLPREADLVFDARFLSNPHYDPALRPLTGRDARVAAYVEADPAFAPFFAGLTGMIEPLLPRFVAEGRSYLTIAIGCTGGRHRSVAVAEKLAGWLGRHGQKVDLRHRDLDEGDRA